METVKFTPVETLRFGDLIMLGEYLQDKAETVGLSNHDIYIIMERIHYHRGTSFDQFGNELHITVEPCSEKYKGHAEIHLVIISGDRGKIADLLLRLVRNDETRPKEKVSKYITDYCDQLYTWLHQMFPQFSVILPTGYQKNHYI